MKQFKHFLSQERQLLDESSKFTKIMHYIHGNKKIGAGIAILTSDNPMGEKSDAATNNKNREELKQRLKDLGKSYFIQRGTYGQEEQSFVILDISDEDAKKLAFDKKWIQDSYIHARPNQHGIIFKLERHNGKKVTTELPKSDASTQTLSDYFSYVQSVMKDRSGNVSVEKRKYVLGFNFPDSFWEDNKIPGKNETPKNNTTQSPQQTNVVNKTPLQVKWVREDENKWKLELTADTYAKFTKFKDTIKLHLIKNNISINPLNQNLEFPNTSVGELAARVSGRRFLQSVTNKDGK